MVTYTSVNLLSSCVAFYCCLGQQFLGEQLSQLVVQYIILRHTAPSHALNSVTPLRHTTPSLSLSLSVTVRHIHFVTEWRVTEWWNFKIKNLLRILPGNNILKSMLSATGRPKVAKLPVRKRQQIKFSSQKRRTEWCHHKYTHMMLKDNQLIQCFVFVLN